MYMLNTHEHPGGVVVIEYPDRRLKILLGTETKPGSDGKDFVAHSPAFKLIGQGGDPGSARLSLRSVITNLLGTLQDRGQLGTAFPEPWKNVETEEAEVVALQEEFRKRTGDVMEFLITHVGVLCERAYDLEQQARQALLDIMEEVKPANTIIPLEEIFTIGRHLSLDRLKRSIRQAFYAACGNGDVAESISKIAKDDDQEREKFWGEVAADINTEEIVKSWIREKVNLAPQDATVLEQAKLYAQRVLESYIAECWEYSKDT